MNWTNTAYQAFIDLCNTIGILPDHLLEKEYPFRIVYEALIPCKNLKKLTVEHWDAWQKQLESGIELRVETSNGNLILELGANINSNDAFIDFRDGSEDIQDDDSFKTTVVLDKTTLAARYFDPELLPFVKIFFASINFRNILIKPITKIQEYLFNDANGEMRDFVIIILLDERSCLEGPCLVVCGADQTKKLANSQLPANEVTNTISQFREKRKDHSYWTALDTKLTPLHFRIGKIYDQVEHSLVEALSRVNLALSLAYIADAVEVEESRFLCSFLGIARSDIECDLSESSQAIKQNYADRMAEWAYEETERISDRLAVLRQSIALRLGSDKKSNLINFVNESETLYRVSIAAYRDRFLENIKLQFQRRKEYTDYVHKNLSDFGDQIGNIARNVTTTALTVLGVLIGLFITDLPGKNISEDFVIKLAEAYSIYLLSFPLAYSGINIIFDYSITLSEYKKQKKRFIRELSKEEVKEITGSLIIRRQVQFWLSFAFSIAFYLFIAWIIWFRSEWIFNFVWKNIVKLP